MKSIILLGSTKTGKTGYIESFMKKHMEDSDFICLDWKWTDYIEYEDIKNVRVLTDTNEMEEAFRHYAERKKEERPTYVIAENMSLYSDMYDILIQHIKDLSNVFFIMTLQYADEEMVPKALLDASDVLVSYLDGESSRYLYGDDRAEHYKPGEFVQYKR